MIVPFPAGGALDTVARVLSERMRTSLGQPVIIENVIGGAGNVGVARLARAAPDGYTLDIGGWVTHVLNGAIFPLKFDVRTDFEPVCLIATQPMLIIGKKTLPAETLKDLIVWLTANPDKALVGHAGVGTTGHISGLFFQTETGARLQFVPYRGLSLAMQDLLAIRPSMPCLMYATALSKPTPLRQGAIWRLCPASRRWTRRDCPDFM
jgi:tripartite-type tricarboxylate transporter receptor subunit TctC